MFDFLKNYDGKIVVNGVEYSSSDIDKINDIEGEVEIYLSPVKVQETNERMFYVEVMDWMTIRSDDNPRFHDRYNNGIAMPNVAMQGFIVEDALDMLKMKLVTLDNSVTWEGFIKKNAILRFEEIKR